MVPYTCARGTSYPGVEFPHIDHAVDAGIISDVVLLSDRDVDANYQRMFGRTDTQDLLHWDRLKYKNYGPTTNAGILVALDLASRVEGKNIVLNAYDYMDMHDI